MAAFHGSVVRRLEYGARRMPETSFGNDERRWASTFSNDPEAGQKLTRPLPQQEKGPAYIEDRAASGHREGDLLWEKKYTYRDTGRAAFPFRDARKACSLVALSS